MSWLLETVLWWTLGYTCLFQFWFLWCVCPAVGLLGCMAALLFIASDFIPSPVISATGCCFFPGSMPSWNQNFLSVVSSQLISCSISGTCHPWEFFFLCGIFCHSILLTAFSKQGYWRGFPLPSLRTSFCQNSSPWPVHLGWPYTHDS